MICTDTNNYINVYSTIKIEKERNDIYAMMNITKRKIGRSREYLII